jgi:hypothetical protein
VESKRSLRRPRRSTLIQDSLTIDRLRSYPNPLAQRNLANEIDSKTVQTMMAVTEEHYGFAQDYFGLKAKLLELPRLAFYDQYAPVGKEAALSPMVKHSRSFSMPLNLSIRNFGKLPENFSPIIGSVPRFATASAVAHSALHLRRGFIRIYSATTMTICAVKRHRSVLISS